MIERRPGAVFRVALQRVARHTGAEQFGAAIAREFCQDVRRRILRDIADRLTGRGVPAPYQAVVAAGQKLAAIGAKGERPERLLRSGNLEGYFRRAPVDDGDRAADRGSSDS